MRALVCGAGGFIGGHLVSRLKAEGYWVRGVDIKRHEWGTEADSFQARDLRDPIDCRMALRDGFDEVYQLAADMGGMGFISQNACECLHNSALINIHMVDEATRAGVNRYFYSSSVCVYRDMTVGEPPLSEDDAYPGQPDNEYGWEKLYSERVLQAYARRHGFQARIARFQNCYGPKGTWRGGREKAPAAMCRKVAETADGGDVEVWGDGRAVRNYTYVDDLVDGIYRLMHSDITEPTNIGTDEYRTVDELVYTVAKVANKRIHVVYVDGPVGVESRNFTNERIKSTGWKPQYTLAQGIAETYPWIAEQVKRQAGDG